MPSIIIRRAPGIAFAVARPPEGLTRGSRVPWMTAVGTWTAMQRLGAVAGGDDRVQLARHPRRRMAAVVGAGRHLADHVFFEGEAGRADHLEGLHRAGDHLVARHRRVAEQDAVDLEARLAAAAVAGGRHDRDHRAEAPRVVDRHLLDDHPAHRGADHVGGVDLEEVEQARPCPWPCRAAGRARWRGGRSACRLCSAPRPSRSWSSGRCRGCRSGSRGSRGRRAGGRGRPARRSSGSPGPSPGPAARRRARPSPGSRARCRLPAPCALRRTRTSGESSDAWPAGHGPGWWESAPDGRSVR